MSLMLSASASLLFFMAVSFSCQGDKSNEAEEDAVYYFPEKNVYYDTRESRYYYSLNGGGSWDSMNYKGTTFGTALGPKITINRTEENIWANNEQDRQKHNGVLLNTINSRTILIVKNDSTSKTKKIIIAGKKAVLAENEPPPKKGLKKFINNLFGKKKKQSEEKQQ